MVAAVPSSVSPELAIVGGGITGLYSAWRAIENGQDPARITVLEASARLGGKIQTGYRADGSPVNLGAEFIDSEHAQLRALCEALGVKLTPAAESDAQESFQAASGKMVSGEAFHAQFAPLHAQIVRDQREALMHPEGPLAQRLNGMSMAEYVEGLRKQVPVNPQPSLWQRLLFVLPGEHNRVAPEVTAMALHAYASEAGRPAREVSALQFVHEASPEMDAFLASDCGFRVEGGTEKIIDALTLKLKEKGVRFTHRAVVKRMEKDGDGVALHLAEGVVVKADKAVLALPAYAVGAMEGLETLGMPQELQQFVGEIQYTKGMKFTVKLQPGMKGQQGAFFADGYQVWSAKDDEVTFLVNADATKGPETAAQAMRRLMENYASVRGVNADALFDASAGNILFKNPGKSPCYASPAPGEVMKLERLQGALRGLEAHGVAVAGSFVPQATKHGMEIGFMECAVNSAQQAVDRLVPPRKERAEWMEQLLDAERGRGAEVSQGAQR